MPHANNKGADQSAYPRSLVSAFVVHCLDSKITLFAIAENSRPKLVSEADLTGLSLIQSGKPRRQVFWWRGSYHLTKSCAVHVSLLLRIFSYFTSSSIAVLRELVLSLIQHIP